MAFRLGDFVLAGELFNLRRNATHGWMMIRGWEQPLHFELTGNPEPDLAGRRLYFEVSPRLYEGMDQRHGDELHIDPRQLGATGIMTARTLVRAREAVFDEFNRPVQLPEPPPLQWKRRLYLEWSGNNGLVVVELVDPVMYFIERRDGQEVRIPLEAAEEPPFDPQQPPEPNAALLGWSPSSSRPEDFPHGLAEEEGFDLFSEELTRYLEENFGEEESAPVSAEKGDDELWAELELMDELIERGGGMEMGELIGKTPDWQSLSEERAEILLKALVARLARYRIAFDVCEHCSMRQAYRILVEELANNAHVHPELRGTDWVTHFSTSDSCEECEAEAEHDFEDFDPE